MSVTLNISDDIALITMDDGKANAVSHQLLDELEPALEEAEQKAKAVVLAGRSGRFCAGFDLKVIQGSDPNEAKTLGDRGGRMVHRLYGYPKPLVAAVTGHALALGALWILGCDTRVGASGDFKIGLNETAINAPLPVFGTEIASARLHPLHLTESVIQARIYDPETAISIGFLDRVVPLDSVINEATNIATQLAALPGQAYRANKLTLRQATLKIIDASFT